MDEGVREIERKEMSEELANSISSMPESQNLYADVCHIIDETRTRVAVYVNAEVCMTNWQVGKRIKEDVLYNKRAEYGKQIVKNLSVRLTERYGKGWSEKTLRHCLRAAETFTKDDIVSTVDATDYYIDLLFYHRGLRRLVAIDLKLG